MVGTERLRRLHSVSAVQPTSSVGLIERPRFLIDLNVGRLAKWLRVMGYDAVFLPDADDGELLRVAKMQGRVLVTRDRYILERRVVTSGEAKVLLVSSDDFRRQMHELASTLSLDFQSSFSRCIECNQALRSIAKEQVEERVPPFVFSTQEQFHECRQCRRLYWRGTHWHNMRAELATFTRES